MSTLQEYWDVCLIKTWRNNMMVLDAVSMFYSITGKRLEECELLRVPRSNFPWKTGTKVFTSRFLPKINDWLWDKPIEKDLDLLRKLCNSKYDTEKKQYVTNADRELSSAVSKNRRDRQKKEYLTRLVGERNSATDWNVVKGAAKVRVRRK